VKTRLVLAAALLAGSGAVYYAAAQAPSAPMLYSAVAQAPDGQALYSENCRKCHGAIGTPPKAIKAKFPKIATFDAAFILHRSNDSIVKVLTKGVGKAEDMKSFKDKLTHEQMEAVAKYVTALGKKAH
jgi:mono/diheme cytochrome c family protein